MDRYVSHEGKENVIYQLHWDCIATQDGVSNRMYGTHGLKLHDLSDFTAYEDLTEEQVMAWLADAIDVEEIEGRCQAGLEKKINPERLKGLPWEGVDGEEEEG